MMDLNKVCYRTVHLQKPYMLQAYEELGGYSVWCKLQKKEISVDSVFKEIKKSNLKGRGGAGFPVWKKLSLVKDNIAQKKYVICNLSESDPGTFKDGDILRYNPHQLIEGMLIVAYIVGATRGYNYIKGKLVKYGSIMEEAITTAKSAELINNTFELSNFYSDGGYICGEETALIETMEGRVGKPRIKPPFPTECGLYNAPTVVINAETLATIPVILEKGADWYLKSGGYKIFSISGHVKRPGNYEVPLGTPFKELLKLAGGMNDNKQLKAVFPGGIATPILPANVIMDLNMDYNSLQKVGSSLGTGGIIVFNEESCMVVELTKVLQFFYQESCRKCAPCIEGVQNLLRIVNKKNMKLLDLEADRIFENSMCTLGKSIALVTKSFINFFKNSPWTHTSLADHFHTKSHHLAVN